MTAPPGTASCVLQELQRTRAGRRWTRLYHAHEREVASLMTVHPDVREHVTEALVRLAEATTTRAVDETTLRAAGRVLDDLSRLGTTELRSTVAGLREELQYARGQSLDEMLGG